MLPRWSLAALVLVPGFAAAAPDPLRLIPKEAGVVVVVERPRALAEAARGLEAYRSAQDLPAVRAALDSTTARRFFQLVGYYERELGAKWPDLLDKLAGGGIAVGAALAADPAPTLLAVQGTDEDAVAHFYRLAVRVLEGEAARAAGGNPDAPAATVRRAARRGIETIHVGKDFHAARVGPVVYVANNEAALHAGLDLAADGKPGKSAADLPGPRAARKLLGGDPLAWVWVDFAKVKEQKATRDFLESTPKDFLGSLVLGGTVDVLRRADFVAAGLFRTDAGVRGVVRLPAKRADLAPHLGPVHAPPAGTPGSLPLLEPKGVVYSQSFYLDLGHYWKDRKGILNGQQLADLEKADKDISKVLPGPPLGRLLELSGPYHRFVVANRDEQPYGVAPDQVIPPMALVSSMRDPQFGKSAAAALRAGGLVGSLQYGLKMTEETHDGVKVVSYRFPEKGSYPGDAGNVRFNFVPSFAVVGDSLVVASRPGLIRDLIPELRKAPDPARSSPAVWRARGYAAGLADSLRAFPDQVVANAVLADGAGLDEAKAQVDRLAKWVATLGTAGLEADHGADAYEVRFEWKTGR